MGQDYSSFVKKFETKKTTDDCYTPPAVYEAVRQWALDHLEGIGGLEIIRPFYPGGDYAREDYAGKVVIDNPPFSIFAEIRRFFLAHDIPFLLFAPHMTLFSPDEGVCHICTAASVTYENGAVVSTSFITNRIPGIVATTAPDLLRALERAGKERPGKVPPLPKYTYPTQVVTASRLEKLNDLDHPVSIRRDESVHVRALDSQRLVGKAIFGGGLLIGEGAAARLRFAERERKIEMERRYGSVILPEQEWVLSPDEVATVKALSPAEYKNEVRDDVAAKRWETFCKEIDQRREKKRAAKGARKLPLGK